MTTALNRLPDPANLGASRTPSIIASAPSGFEGEGFPVRRAFAGIPLAALDPFIHMDQMGEVEYAPGEPKGTPWHPHRGFETFTYLIDGEFVHQDSHGGGGVITPGGTQYMTAGSGILHIETPPEHLVQSGGLFHGIQLWINLPRKHKMTAPRYQDLQTQSSPQFTGHDGSGQLRLLAGSLAGHAGPASTHTPFAIAHATVDPGTRMTVPWEERFNAIVYVLSGSGRVGGAPVETGQTVVLHGGSAIDLTADTRQDSRHQGLDVMVLGGEPIREPVAAYGPFVMNTRADIIEAMEDYQAGRFGSIPANAIQPGDTNRERH